MHESQIGGNFSFTFFNGSSRETWTGISVPLKKKLSGLTMANDGQMRSAAKSSALLADL